MFESASPYLKLFSNRAIKWHYCFTKELLKRAEEEDKLFFIHLGGFGSLLQREQTAALFGDPEIISLLNDNFICIIEDKVDKPETFLLALDLLFLNEDFSTGPMSLIVTPAEQPIICFSETNPMDCKNIINSILLAKKEKRERLMTMANELSKRVSNTAVIVKGQKTRIEQNSLIELIKEWIAKNQSDFTFWLSPYNASPNKLISQLACLKYSGGADQYHRFRSILNHYQYSALFDPICGGFFSQAKDATCKESLFEKNLYLNCSFLMLYAKAYKILGEESYKKTAELIYRFIIEELQYRPESTKEDGSFGLSLCATLTCKLKDADYYTYSMGEIMLLFPDRYEDISAGLSFLVDTSGEKKRHIPVRTKNTYKFISEEDLMLLKERRKEHRNYYIDKRIVSEDNFRAVKALAISSELLGNRSMLEDAVTIFNYVIKHNICSSNKKLFRYSHAGKQYFVGNLSDYANLIDASIELYKKNGDEKYLNIALDYTDITYRKFHKSDNFMFYKSEQNTSIEENCVPFRREFNIDLFKPSANSIMANNLISLYEVSGREKFLQNAHHQISNIAPNIPDSGPMLSNWIGVILHFLAATE